MIPLPEGDPILAFALAKVLGVRPPALAKRSREGRGPRGRFLLAGRAAYPRTAVETWLLELEAAAPARLEAARARAARARAALASRRAEAGR